MAIQSSHSNSVESDNGSHQNPFIIKIAYGRNAPSAIELLDGLCEMMLANEGLRIDPNDVIRAFERKTSDLLHPKR